MAQVQSANTVGYTTVNCAADKWYMLGAQFEDTASTASTRVALTLQDLVQGVVGVDYDDKAEFTGTAPQVQIYDSTKNSGKGGYDIRYYLNDGWYDDNGKDGYAPGWCDSFGNLVADEIVPGKAMWFKSPSGDTVKLLGAVIGGTAPLVCASGKWEMPIVALPKVTSLNDSLVTWSGVASVDYDDNAAFTGTAAQIQIWDPTKNNGKGGYNIRYHLNDGWYDDNGKDGYAPGWCDSFGNLVNDTIPEGYGFWFKPTTAVTIQCASPL